MTMNQPRWMALLVVAACAACAACGAPATDDAGGGRGGADVGAAAGVEPGDAADLRVGTPAVAPDGETPRPPSPPDPAAAERAVQAQLEAYNAGDLEGFLAQYADDIRMYVFPDTEIGSGIEDMRENYGQLFESVPGLHARITSRLVYGDYVIDDEVVTGVPGQDSIRAIAIYRVRDGKIANVWFIH